MDENWYAVEYEVREQLRRARTGMLRDPYLMEPYLQDAVRREQIAEARRQAAREHAFRRAASSRTRHRWWAIIQRLVQATALVIALSLTSGRVVAIGVDVSPVVVGAAVPVHWGAIPAAGKDYASQRAEADTKGALR